MNVKITRSKKFEKFQPLFDEDCYIIDDFSNKDWELLYRRLGHFNGNELCINLDVDMKRRLGNEDSIPYALISADGKMLYIVTSFDVYNYNVMVKQNERTAAFMLYKSKILRNQCREIINYRGASVECYDIELSEHIERELHYQRINEIDVPAVDPIMA